MNEKLSDRIRALREAAGLSQKELAKLMDVDQSTVSKWENGQREPSFDDLTKLYTALRGRVGDNAPRAAKAARDAFDVVVGGKDDSVIFTQVKGRTKRGAPPELPKIPLHTSRREAFGPVKMDDTASGFLDPLAFLSGADIYATTAADDNVAPAIRLGDCAIMDANRQARGGDVVFVRLSTGEAFFAELKGESPSDPQNPMSPRVVAFGFSNPPTEFTVEADKIKAADPVIATFRGR